MSQYHEKAVGEVSRPDNAAPVACPYCGSNETEFSALFGRQLMTQQYYCAACHTPFDHVRDDDVNDEAETLANERTAQL